jgi:urea carboxylase
VAEGDRVAKGQPLVSLEAMKMETVLEAPCDGVVLRVLPAAGGQVVAGEAVVVLGAPEPAGLEELELEEAAV